MIKVQNVEADLSTALTVVEHLLLYIHSHILFQPEQRVPNFECLSTTLVLLESREKKVIFYFVLVLLIFKN